MGARNDAETAHCTARRAQPRRAARRVDSGCVCCQQRKQRPCQDQAERTSVARGAGVRVRPALGQGLTHIYGRMRQPRAASPRLHAPAPRAPPDQRTLVHSDNRCCTALGEQKG